MDANHPDQIPDVHTLPLVQTLTGDEVPKGIPRQKQDLPPTALSLFENLVCCTSPCLVLKLIYCHSCSTQPGKQPHVASVDSARTDTLFAASNSPETLLGHQGNPSSRVCSTGRETQTARSAGSRQDRRKQDEPSVGFLGTSWVLEDCAGSAGWCAAACVSTLHIYFYAGT